MGGGLMQLVAYGAQDVYLTGNPQITFFKVVYRRHTNFSLETIEHTLGGNPDFGRKATVTVTRNGDLATKMYLRVVLNSLTSASNWAYVRRLGHALLKSVELGVGGSKIDKQYGVWMDVWHELTVAAGQVRGYNKMIGDVSDLTDMALTHGEYTMYIPLQFWFCRNTGLALPLIALQYHEVRVHFEFTAASELVRYATTGSTSAPAVTMKDASLLVDYVYLDSEERRRFAQVGHEYLIEQLQFTGEESARDNVQKYKLGFNHPTKELVWAARSGRFMGNTFLGESLDEVAKELVKAKFGVAAAAGTDAQIAAFGAAWADASDAKLTVDADAVSADAGDLSGTSRLLYASAADVNSLYAKVSSATVLATNSGVTVTSVAHTLTMADVSLKLSEMTDSRKAASTNVTPQSASGAGVVVTHWNNYGCFLDGTGNPVSKALIQLNGHDRFDAREGAYFNYVQPHQHHSNTPADGVNVYSFALHPEQHQPSGTANLSRIDNTQLNVWYSTGKGLTYIDASNKLYVFGLSNNVFRVMSGMGGLAYSN
jgi:hypothetical protein